MPLLDTHCHIDLYADYAALISECERGRIATVAVTNAPSVFATCARLLRGQRFLRAALGLHPELVHERHGEIELFRQLLPHTRFVGEVGLDYTTPDELVRKVQARVFEAVLTECARAGSKVLTVHSRRAAPEVVDMVGTGFPGAVILHWFSGNRKTTERALAHGCYFSVNPAMITSESGRRLASLIPPERLLTETDGPFTSIAGRPCRPSDVERVIAYLARAWGQSPADVADRIYRTWRYILAPPIDGPDRFDSLS